MRMLPFFLTDFYKYGHRRQYPNGTTKVWSNWTPRYSRNTDIHSAVVFGNTYFIKEYLIGTFNEFFFHRPWSDIATEFREFITSTLNESHADVSWLKEIYDLGYLPLAIYALPEGVSSPIGIPQTVITNTHDCAYWLPNFIETMMSATVWLPGTSATTAREFRKLGMKYAVEAGEKDFSFLDWQFHDFSMRGMGSIESAITSGMGHLLFFSGTDTAPAIIAANKYYRAGLNIGGSVDATEHAVMCAGSKEGELETIRRLLVDVYPEGILSIVSDTWDLWKVLLEYLPQLKQTILRRNGKLVIRPDSGDPVKILCGDDAMKYVEHSYPNSYAHPAYYGVIEILSKVFGLNRNREGLPMINSVGTIYGDAITLSRADQILSNVVRVKKLSPYNCVFGIGSYTYQYVTRDVLGYAQKATAIAFADGKVVPIFKNPITDNGGKKSHCGIPIVYESDLSTNQNPDYFCVESMNPNDLDHCAFQKIFENGELLVDPYFSDIRSRARAAA